MKSGAKTLVDMATKEVKDMKVIAVDHEEALALFSAFYLHTYTLPCIYFDEKHMLACFENGSTLMFVGDKNA